MVAIWWGTQADEAFPEAWQSDTGAHALFRSKVYLSPKLWYLRVNIIEAQDLTANDKGRLLEPVAYLNNHLSPFLKSFTSFKKNFSLYDMIVSLWKGLRKNNFSIEQMLPSFLLGHVILPFVFNVRQWWPGEKKKMI